MHLIPHILHRGTRFARLLSRVLLQEDAAFSACHSGCETICWVLTARFAEPSALLTLLEGHFRCAMRVKAKPAVECLLRWKNATKIENLIVSLQRGALFSRNGRPEASVLNGTCVSGAAELLTLLSALFDERLLLSPAARDLVSTLQAQTS
eukprot:6199356-Pleurochrysis_carterae.AAC.1